MVVSERESNSGPGNGVCEWRVNDFYIKEEKDSETWGGHAEA